MTEKKKLRDAFRRKLLGAERDLEVATKVCARLSEFLNSAALSKHPVWGAFHAIGHEPDLTQLFQMRTDIDWAFPRIEEKHLQFYRSPKSMTNPWTDPWVDTWILNRMGIREPDPDRSIPIAIRDLDGLLIPGLAFDQNCNRLGRGAGYYDRALFDRENAPLKIGVCFENQICPDPIDADSHDIPMDWIVTETRTLANIESQAKNVLKGNSQ